MTEHGHLIDSGHARLTVRVLGPFAAILLLVVSAFLIATYYEESEHISGDLHARLDSFGNHFQNHVQQETRLITLALSQIAASPELAAALEARDRRELLRLGQPYFRQWRDAHQITHFYFHAPDRINLLRLHQPERFGDLIERHTARQAQRTGTITSGIELGPLGMLTLRAVLPVYRDSRLAGFVELGKEIEPLIEHLVPNSGLDYVITLDKRFLKRPQWEDGMRLLGRDPRWDDYPAAVVRASTLKRLPEGLTRALAHDTLAGLDGDTDLPGDGRIYRAMSLPMRDVTGSEVGRIVLAQDVMSRLGDLLYTLTLALLGALAVGVPGLWLIYLFLRRIEMQLLESRRLLVSEARAREAEQRAHIQELELQQTRLQQALNANRHKSEFLARMSHELRTPLHAIIGYSDALLEGLDGEIAPAQRESLSVIHGNGAHLLELINDLLDLTKIEAGKMTLHKDHVDLARIIDETLKTVAPMIRSKGLTLTVAHAPLPPIHADPMRVKQILLNLLSNSAKFTPQGEIVIETRPLAPGDALPGKPGQTSTGHQALVSIRDSGIGMDQKELSEIFKEFYQADRSRREPGSGTGLGLAICNCLVQMHGGQIWASSVPERGTTFWFTLPPVESAPAEEVFLQSAGI